MNAENIDRAFRHVLSAYRPDIVLSAGFGGALYYRAGIGELVIASRYFFLTREGAIELPLLSARNERIQQSLWNGSVAARLRRKIPIHEGSFITLPQWLPKTKLKSTLPPDARFPVCEQETAQLAKRSYENNIPFFGIRAITDRIDEDIPEELFQVTDENGNYRLSRALRLLLSRPALIPRSLQLGRHAAIASRNLAEAVKALAEVVGSSRMAMRFFLGSRSSLPQFRSLRED